MKSHSVFSFSKYNDCVRQSGWLGIFKLQTDKSIESDKGTKSDLCSWTITRVVSLVVLCLFESEASKSRGNVELLALVGLFKSPAGCSRFWGVLGGVCFSFLRHLPCFSQFLSAVSRPKLTLLVLVPLSLILITLLKALSAIYSWDIWVEKNIQKNI